MIENIRQVNGGYIIENRNNEYVFKDFSEVVQFLARHFSEVGIGEEWKP